jgi:L-lactate dehydrogenase (cytochrome)
MSIVLKGVQRVEDVMKATECGVEGVILSNHGGRQLEYSEPPIEVLAEVMPALRERGLQNNIEVYIDGGIRRGSDILKALCLGARGVGIGRPFLYAMAGYGQKGAEKAIRIYKDELERNMRLLGCTSVDQLHPGLVKVLGQVRERL